MATELSNPGQAMQSKTSRHIVLASASPRRSAIMRMLGLEFDVVPADIDESALQQTDLAQLARRLAESKAILVSEGRPQSCVVAADTVVVFDGQSLGKPADSDEAAEMLHSLSGHAHHVHTGVAVWAGGAFTSGVETTKVQMRDLSDAEIAMYVQSGAPMDKAGGYGIQDAGFSPVESYSGSYSNVVGLPVGLLARLLIEVGQIDDSAADRISRKDAL